MGNERGLRKRLSGVAIALAGFALGFGPTFVVLGYCVAHETERRQLVFGLSWAVGLFVAALALGLASHFDRLRTDGGRSALFPDEAQSTPRPPFTRALSSIAKDAAAFVKEHILR